MKKTIAAFVAVLFLAFPLSAFSCFGIEEGFTKEQCEEAGAKFLEMSKDYGTYQVWMFDPAPINRSDYFDWYYVYIDQTLGAIEVVACSDLLGNDDIAASNADLLFNRMKQSYGKKYNVSEEEIESSQHMLVIGNAGEENIHLINLDASNLFLSDVWFFGSSDYVVAAIYRGKTYYHAMTIYDFNQQTII